MPQVTITGTANDDTLTMNPGDYGTMQGLAGNDSLTAAGGDDLLIGGAGDDFLDGGEGYDIVDYSGAGAAVNLTVVSGQYVQGTAANGQNFGQDLLYNIEEIRGTSFNDTILGSRYYTLTGGEGNDVLGYGEVMDGGNGDDTFKAPHGYYNTYLGGAGYDVVDFSGSWTASEQFRGITVDLNITTTQVISTISSSSSTWWLKDHDTFSSIEGLIGTGRQDRFTGTAGQENFQGMGADDTLEGRGGDDRLDGGAGSDWVSFVDAAGGVTVNLTLQGAAQAIGGGEGSDTLIAFENVIASAHADSLTGDAGANALWGEAGADTLLGLDGDDVLRGGLGDDVINGGNGVDMVDYRDPGMLAVAMYNATPGINLSLSGVQNAGGLGVDTLISIEGAHGSYFDDVLTGDAGANVFEGHNGRDVIYGQEGNDTIWSGGDADTVFGGPGDDTLYAYGVGGLDGANWSYYPNTPGDTLYGEDGNDTIWGRAGDDDRIFGGAGDDVLGSGYGGDVDWFQGGTGNDKIDGGEMGSDYADFSDATGAVNVDLRITTAQAVGGGLGSDTLTNIEHLVGGDFNDTLKADDNWNLLLGGKGNDTLTGFGGADLFGVGQGQDVVTDYLDSSLTADGYGDRFRVVGQTEYQSIQQVGADALVTFAGGNTLLLKNVDATLLNYGDFEFSQTGTGGADVLMGGAYADIIDGGDGSDVINGGGGGNELDGGLGFDWLDYSSSSQAMWVSLGAHAYTIGTGPYSTDWLRNFEALRGSAFDDTLWGDDGANFIAGGKGADFVNAWFGDDTIMFTTGDGHDTVEGFAAGGTEDRLQVTGYSGYQSVQQVGLDTLVTFSASDSILLLGVTASTLTADDFVFGSTYARMSSASGSTSSDTMFGSEGADRIDAWQGDDTVDGLGGADLLYGGYGNDRLIGGAGDDLMDGGLGVDWVDYRTASAAVTVNLAVVSAQNTGGAGVDTLIAIENAFGTSGNDVLTGDGQANTLNGEGGADTLKGEGGNDVLNGGDGDDILEGGVGDDTLAGGAGANDKADYRAAASAVTVNLGLTTAQNTGGAGIDTLSGVEQLLGSAYADTFSAGAAAATLDGKAGNDTLTGGNAGDILIGGAGADMINGGGGLDYASYISAAAAVSINLTNNLHSGDAAGDVFNLIERFRLSAHNDSFTGAAGTDYAYGAEGNDTLNGAGGIDRLYGQDGTDTLNGDAGNDILLGGAGADVFNGGADRDTASYEQSTAAIAINLTTGVHTGDAAGDTWNSVEVLWLSAHADTFTGADAADEVRGAGGADVLNGRGGIDTLRGEDGNDTLSGDDGDDFLHGGSGADTLGGGVGVDTASYLLATAGVTINLTTGVHTGEAAGDAFNSIERFQLSNGFTLNDSFTGAAGNDWVAGYKGNDVLNGMDGDDTLNGGEHHDTLNGGAGLDKLIAGTGNDTLTGGSGSDQFHFNVGLFGADVITDFENGVDFIRITGQAGIDNIADLTITQAGAHVLITLPDGSTITVQNTLTSAIDASDFLWI